MDIHKNVGDITKSNLMRPIIKTLRCRGSMGLKSPTTASEKEGAIFCLAELRPRKPLELSTGRLMVGGRRDFRG